MDRITVYFLLAIPLYFSALHLLILPLLQKISIHIQGTKFTHRLQAGTPSKTTPPYEKFDLLWSFFANVVALAISMIPLAVFE